MGAGDFAVVCDFCDSRTAQLFCMSDGAFLCQSCDGEIHNNRISMRHLRVPYTQCSVWAYREAKSKGRLREGVSPPADDVSLHARDGRGQHDPATHGCDDSTGSQGQWPAGVRPSRLSPAWLDSGSARCMRHGLTDTGAFNPQPHSSTAASFGDAVTATSLRDFPGWLGMPDPPPPVAISGSVSAPQTIIPGTAVNQNLAFLLEEFKLPDGSAEDSLLLELPPSPPSVAQSNYHGALQSQTEPHAMPPGMDIRLTGSLKSCNTGLTMCAMDYDGRSPGTYASPSSNPPLLGTFTPAINGYSGEQRQDAPQQGLDSAVDIRRTASQLFAQYQANASASLAGYATGMPEPTKRGGGAGGTPTAGQSQVPDQVPLSSRTAFAACRSSPMPINGQPTAGARKTSAMGRCGSAGGVGGSRSLVVAAVSEDDGRFLRNGPQTTSSASDLPGNSNTTNNNGQTPDSSLHGSFLGAAALAAAKSGVASFDDASLTAALNSAGLGSPLSTSAVMGGTVHAGTAHSSCLGLSRSLDTAGCMHGPTSPLPMKGVSLLIETASAASIEARAQALINSSSRNSQPTVLDPNVATRIERPDGTFRELDPERAMQLHRYRQKRMSRMKAYTEGQKKIRYECRKQLADSRPRVRGRFAKLGSFDGLAAMLAEHTSDVAFGEHSMRGANSYAELMRQQRIDEDSMFDIMEGAQYVGGSVHGGKAGNLSVGRATQTLRRAASCGQSQLPALTRRSSGGHNPKAVSRAEPSGRPMAAVDTARVSLDASPPPAPTGTTGGSSGHLSSGSPGLMSSNRPVQAPQDDVPCLGAELDAAIAAACEQECVTITDQELEALGFGPLSQQPPTHPQRLRDNSEESSESMCTSVTNRQGDITPPQLSDAIPHSTVAAATYADALARSASQPYASAADAGMFHGSCSHSVPRQFSVNTLPFLASSAPSLPASSSLASSRQLPSPVDHQDTSICMDVCASDFNDPQVSSMLDALFQDAAGDFGL